MLTMDSVDSNFEVRNNAHSNSVCTSKRKLEDKGFFGSSKAGVHLSVQTCCARRGASTAIQTWLTAAWIGRSSGRQQQFTASTRILCWA